MDYLISYAIFLAHIATIVIAILILVAGIIAISSKGKQQSKNKITIKKLNKKYKQLRKTMQSAILDKKTLKQTVKKDKKQQDKSKEQRNIYVINFDGDMRASAGTALREIVSAILTVATVKDEVVINIDSAGGLVHNYGLCASQLKRLRDRNIPLTATVDKVAASGGYMMACVANHIIAAPFAIVGSIGVLAQIPNFHRFLKNHKIDFEQMTAGEYKRTLTMFGENTSKGKQKMQEELEEMHLLFKNFISENRSKVNIDNVATGEYWYGIKAFELNLIDEINTSDDYLLTASEQANIYELNYKQKKSMLEKLTAHASMLMNRLHEFNWQM